MKTVTKTALVAAAFLSMAATVQAQQVEQVTGVGFGETRLQAQTNAARAWVRQAINDYPTMQINLSRAAIRTNCEQVGSGNGYGTLGTDYEGNPNGNWTCSITGIPL
ncbi:MAG: hypothetical protein AAGD23_01080 [Pseudomonadota bacterium]